MSKRLEKASIDDRLLDTAIDQFGRFGFEAASTRTIAAAAETAMSSITYHFGGKEGLYLAAARHIAQQAREGSAAAQAAARAILSEKPGIDGAIEAVALILEGFTDLLTSERSTPWARFIVREQMNPGPAFDILYSELMKERADFAAALVERIGAGSFGAAEARIKTLALFGQVLIFRVARATVLRVTGWSDVTPVEAAEIRRTVRAHTLAILNSIRGDRA
ncbi:CerR family C-terminal domain-containing protein [Sphingomonas sp. LaA6.9]|uniref:CerR family C-terminal domain-containing protein n=1 Tax=Sphingomonas sp. LaA6.9 TaxID=2919914 RepID=UPI001F4F1A9D|nr:CerR family C-terminal domain-containing protein [Sphingomonas sp. LaA6.9]MCJ8156902.1 CerR family C-terminal domain-containing protein [Sphingomonas sp. LaA6.9]